MSREIEEFLKRAAERRAGKSGRKPPRQPQPQRPKPIDVEIIDEVEMVDPTMLVDVSEVGGHLDTTDVTGRLSQLGARVGRADDRMEAHLHETFEHDLGQLGATTSRAQDTILDADSPAGQKPAKKPHPLGDLTKLFSSPDDIRKAILLREIFDRPTHRW